MGDNWVLVADSSRALFFKRGSTWDELKLLHEEEYPRGRAHDGDLVTDDGAEVMQRAGQGQRRSTGPEVSPGDHEADVFARKLADSLSRDRARNMYSSLTLVAAPAFLGRLRTALDDPTRACIKFEVAKNLTQHSAAKIGELLEKESRLG